MQNYNTEVLTAASGNSRVSARFQIRNTRLPFSERQEEGIDKYTSDEKKGLTSTRRTVGASKSDEMPSCLCHRA